MVTYDVDTDPRPRIFYFLAFVSIVGASFLKDLLQDLETVLPPFVAPFVAPSIAPFAIFGLLLWLFDRHLWRWPLIRSISGIPNFEGTWKGTLTRTSSDEAKKDEIQKHKAECYITQTWREIGLVILDFVGTEEQTRVATARIVGMFVKNPQDIHVRYVYGARPTTLLHKLNNVDAMPSEGAAVLRLRDLGKGKRLLQGTYHSDKMRRGDIHLIFEQEDSWRWRSWRWRKGAPPKPKSSS